MLHEPAVKNLQLGYYMLRMLMYEVLPALAIGENTDMSQDLAFKTLDLDCSLIILHLLLFYHHLLSLRPRRLTFTWWECCGSCL